MPDFLWQEFVTTPVPPPRRPRRTRVTRRPRWAMVVAPAAAVAIALPLALLHPAFAPAAPAELAASTTTSAAPNPPNVTVALAATPDGSRVYASFDDGRLTLLNDQGRPAKRIRVPGRAGALAADATRIYVADATGNTVRTISAASGRVLGSLHLRVAATALTLDPLRHRLYAANGHQVWVFNTVTGVRTGILQLNAKALSISVDPVRHRLYVLAGGRLAVHSAIRLGRLAQPLATRATEVTVAGRRVYLLVDNQVRELTPATGALRTVSKASAGPLTAVAVLDKLWAMQPYGLDLRLTTLG